MLDWYRQLLLDDPGIGQGAYRHRNLLARSDDGFLIVACEDRRPRHDFETIGGLKQVHYGGESVAGCHVNVGPAAHVLNDIAEVDQIGGIENVGG